MMCADRIEWPRKYTTPNLGVHFVPPGKVYVVERFGRYAKTLTSGTHFLIPLVERIAYVFPSDQMSVPMLEMGACTQDCRFVYVDSLLHCRVADPKLQPSLMTHCVECFYERHSSILRPSGRSPRTMCLKICLK